MKHTENEFNGAEDLKIFYQCWIPDEPPRGILQIVHGFAEHSGRYMNIVNSLIPHRYAIYANDHRGHGRSEGVKNYVDSFDNFIEDERILYETIRKNHPDLPIFMLGHSTGSGIAIYFTDKYEQLLNGLILSGTGTTLGEETSSFLKFISKLLSKIIPKMTIDPNLKAEKLSHDSEVVEAYKNDPLVNDGFITVRLAHQLLVKFKQIPSIIEKFKLPLLVQCGSEEKLVQGIDQLIDHFRMKDKTIKVYEGLYHEVYNEIRADRERVLDDLVQWLKNHI